MAGLRSYTSIDQLPEILPIFPLPGVLLLPRGKLPLRIFEPRYLAMTDDAIAGDRLIGMIQPADPAAPLAGAPPVYHTGCVGRITAFSETDDGHYLLTLCGIARFDVREELPPQSGYRRVRADWRTYAADLREEEAEDAPIDRDRLLTMLKSYFKLHGLSADWDAVRQTPDERLVTSLAMICPFEPSEKQALLEAPTLVERAKVMTAMIEMAVLDGPKDGDGARH
jgi:Lon protease-like protein